LEADRDHEESQIACPEERVSTKFEVSSSNVCGTLARSDVDVGKRKQYEPSGCGR
jgi:hypothetical protein